MDYKFLDKVVDQIITETRIDYDMGKIQFPFLPLSLPLSPSSPFFIILLLYHPLSLSSLPIFSFSDHCKNVYGLKGIEVEYVWEEYVQIIKDKIDSNGL